MQTFPGISKNACMKISQWLLFSYQIHLCMGDIRRRLSVGYYFLIVNMVTSNISSDQLQSEPNIFLALINSSLSYSNCCCSYLYIFIQNQVLGCLLKLS